MSFSQALSGINAQSENLETISNNIANSQTIGYKDSRVSFGDIFAGASSVGQGVSVTGVTQDFSTGPLQSTGRELDLAISGNGFYRLESQNGEIVYSRNGEFNQDANGNIVNQVGQFLTGYGLSDPTDPFSDIVVGGDPIPLTIPSDDIPPSATTISEGIYNLDSSVIPGNDLQTLTVATSYDPLNPNEQTIEYDYSSSFTVYDSLGNSRIMTLFFRKDSENPSVWESTIAFDGVIENFGGGPAGAGGSTNAFSLEFDQTGQLIGLNGGTDTDITIQINGTDNALGGAVNPFVFDFDFAGTTQYSSESLQNSLSQDGYTSGSLIGLEVTEDGRIVRVFSNEERRDAGQLILADFPNQEGLSPDGNNAWKSTNASGEPNLGVAGTGQLGSIESQMLEGSNVNLSDQLVNMIIAQRAYQANSTSISTQDEILQTIINL